MLRGVSVFAARGLTSWPARVLRPAKTPAITGFDAKSLSFHGSVSTFWASTPSEIPFIDRGISADPLCLPGETGQKDFCESLLTRKADRPYNGASRRTPRDAKTEDER